VPVSKILIVHTNPSIRLHMAEFASDSGYEVLTATSPREGLEYLKSNYDIDLILIDTWQPDASGVSILMYLRRTPKYAFVPVLVCAEVCDTAMVKGCLQYGATDIICPPFARDIINEKIAMALLTGKSRILLVDDNELLLEHLAYVLELEGYKAHTSGTGKHAIALLDSGCFDLVISDIVLPDITGLDVLQCAKHKQNDLPVILITGFHGRYATEDMLKAGADAYLPKPFKNRELLDVVRPLITMRRRLTGTGAMRLAAR